MAYSGTQISQVGQITDPHLMIENFQGKFTSGLYALAHVAGWKPYNRHYLWQNMFPRIDMYYSDPAYHLITANCDLYGLYRPLADVSTICRLGTKV